MLLSSDVPMFRGSEKSKGETLKIMPEDEELCKSRRVARLPLSNLHHEKRRPTLILTPASPPWQARSWERGTGSTTRKVVSTFHNVQNATLLLLLLTLLRDARKSHHPPPLLPSRHASSAEPMCMFTSMATQHLLLHREPSMATSRMSPWRKMLWPRLRRVLNRD